MRGGITIQNPADLSGLIDHTLLKPDATLENLKKLCEEAVKYGFYSVCVSPSYIPTAAEFLKGSKVLPITVIGFPSGTPTTASKAFETADAVKNGAREIDMVINVGMLKNKNHDYVREDIAAVVKAAQGVPVKVIIETSLLNLEEKKQACILSKEAGAQFVKTCTGFNGGGATVEDIGLMRQTVGPEMGVKASGGIRHFAQAKSLIEAGADRLGMSASVAIVTGNLSQSGY